MPQMTIYLQEADNNALNQLAHREFRTPKEQAALIILIELAEQGLLDAATDNENEPSLQ